jgi:hypothetical protein
MGKPGGMRTPSNPRRPVRQIVRAPKNEIQRDAEKWRQAELTKQRKKP